MGLTRRSFKRCEISRRRSRWKGAALRPPHQGLIVDLCTGDLIKLDSVGRVTAALHGERWRSLDEIATVYGVAEWRLYGHLSRVENHRDYWLLVTAFDTPAQPIWARIVDLMARGTPASPMFPSTTSVPCSASALRAARSMSAAKL